MKLEDQVCSLEPAKKLKELGVPQDAYFHHYINPYHGNVGAKYVTWKYKEEGYPMKGSSYAAFSVAELGELLPQELGGDYGGVLCITTAQDWNWDVDYYSFRRNRSASQLENAPYFHFVADTEANARAKMLVYLLENKLIEV